MFLASARQEPATPAGHDLRRECRSVARRRALLAAASSLIPLPGIDLATDLAVMSHLVRRIETAFGLDAAQIAQLSAPRQVFLHNLLARAGGTLASRLTTPALLGHILRLSGLRLSVMEVTRLVPVAGQVVAASIGYWAVMTVATRHIVRCEHLLAEFENDRMGA